MLALVILSLSINFNPSPLIDESQTKNPALSGIFSLALPKIFGIVKGGWLQPYASAQNTISLPK